MGERTKGAAAQAKGKTGERDVANLFQAAGFNARRGIGQFQSASLVPDVVLDDLQMYWIEVKRGAQTAPFAALEQATLACKGKKIPLAICRNDGGKHNVTMYLTDWMAIRSLSGFGIEDQTTKVSIPIDLFLNYFTKKHADKCKQLSFKRVTDTNPVADTAVRSIDVSQDSTNSSPTQQVQLSLIAGIKTDGPS